MLIYFHLHTIVRLIYLIILKVQPKSTYKILLLSKIMGHHSAQHIIYKLKGLLHLFYDLMALLIDRLFYLYMKLILFYFIINYLDYLIMIFIYLLLLILQVLINLLFVAIILIIFIHVIIIISFLVSSLFIGIILCHLCVCMDHFEQLCLSS